LLILFGPIRANAQETVTPAQSNIFDDQFLIEGYSERYGKEPLSILLAMIRDDSLDPLKTAAAVRALRNRYSDEIFAKDKIVTEKTLLRRLNKADSAFIQVEIMHTLCRIDRYQYFKPLATMLLLKIDHYNATVSAFAAAAINDLIQRGKDTAWEARIIFSTLRKVFFLSRYKLSAATEQSPALREKLKILRWSIKVLGSEKLRELPKEVIPLL